MRRRWRPRHDKRRCGKKVPDAAFAQVLLVLGQIIQLG